MQIFTHNQILKTFSDFVAGHLQLRTFGSGSVSEIAEIEDVQYPLMWAMLQPGSFAQNTIAYNYDIFFMDLVKADIGNIDEVYSDCILYAADLIAQLVYLANNETNFFYTLSQSYEPFEDDFKDAVTGVKISVEIRTIGYQDNKCKIPES